ncbi:MAG: T9SS type A sorting domain-containing protein [Bacteroidales bacterium]|nr:T9SS type A sorting domain-containing protein [Bacteroidales bacterium]
MKTHLFTLIAILISIATYSQTIVPPGTISGTWTLAGSPYLIEGMTWISDTESLTIEPGVLVEWQGSFTMYVQGQILALGTETDSITFTAADPSTGFKSIRFIETPSGNDTSRFVYCIFKYGNVYGPTPDNAGGALASLNFSKIIVDHCLFADNKALEFNIENPSGGAIALDASSPLIRNSKFINNESYWGGAIFCCNGSHPLIENNVFANNTATLNAGAILCAVESDPIIDHNLFYGNTSLVYSGAIEVSYNCSTQIINNTIANNHASNGGGSFLISNDCNVLVKNTILWGNTADGGGNQVYIYDNTNVLDFYYCDIEGGEEEFGGVPFLGEYEDNIDYDPEFEDIEVGDYHLTEDSPCIDAGDPEMFDPDGTISDIGAFFYDQTVGFSEFSVQNSGFGIGCYPNPSSGISEIKYRLQVGSRQSTVGSHVRLSIYDMRGKEFRTIVNEEQTAGEYTIPFDVSDLPNGFYLIRLQTGERIETTKLVLMK